MNYDLLKLSKILPTIKGKKTIEIYEESLQKAREAHQAQQEENAQSPFYSPKSQGYNSSTAVGRAYKKLSDAKSATKLTNNTLEDSMHRYLNLQVLLKGEENMDSLTASVRMRSKQSLEKGLMSSSATGFHSTRPSTSGIPPGNFVFRKKKINLREADEALHIHHYALGTGVNFLPESPSSSLKGRKVNVRETSTDLVVRQQKTYLKNLKQDPGTTFHGPNLDGLSSDLNNVFTYNNRVETKTPNERGLLGSSKGMSYRQKMKSNASQDFDQLDTPKRMSLLTLDGNYLKSFDSKKTIVTISSPVKAKVSSRGFAFQ